MSDEPTSASWHLDPTGRHEYRWWDGAAWTDHVSDQREETSDPITSTEPSPDPPVPNWWDDLKPVKIGINAIYLNVKTPTKSSGMGTLRTTLEGVQWRGNLGIPKIVMPWATIRDITIEGESSARLTASRVVGLGVFALGAKKRTRDAHIGVLTDTAERGFLLEKTAPEAVRTRLMPVLAKLAEQQAPEPTAAQPVVGVADEIAKLAALRDAGALTDDEFAAQKAKLLA